MPPSGHIPVLAAEVVAHLAPAAGEVYLDCTAGLGGHAALIAPAVGEPGTIVLCDLDAANLERAEARIRSLSKPSGVVAMRGNFAEAPGRMAEQGLRADMVLADLGFASTQVDDPARGLSFSRPGPLDMRLDPAGALTAAQFVAAASEIDLARVIDEYGEERHARLVARRIVEARKSGPITTTDQLAGIVRAAVGPRGSGGIDPATRTFQALRIAVNDELGNLHALLASVRNGAKPMSTRAWLRPGARIAVISFHSLEDRPVKQAFAELVESGAAEHVVRKPVTASDDELRQNPRSRSAKLRVIRIVSPP
ncbi:MAG: 16S rRNA (cytosine(1402)-N(4))-methyltransferase RsmH [Phycisphaerales bacterium]